MVVVLAARRRIDRRPSRRRPGYGPAVNRLLRRFRTAATGTLLLLPRGA